MIVQASSVAMSSERSYSKVESSMSMTVTSKADDAVKVDISDKSRSLFKQLQEGLEEKERAKKEEDAAKKEKQKQVFLDMAKRSQKTNGEPNLPAHSEEELELKMLRRILESLRRHQKGGHSRDTKQSNLLEPFWSFEERRGASAGLQMSVSSSMESMSAAGSSVRNTVSVGRGGGREYKIQTVTSSFFAEQEVTEFSTTGVVRTADGREITFGVSVEMSRSFAQSMEIYTEGSYVLKDPLVINLDTNIAEVSDKKFYFDLDGDGEEEEISELGRGSGYLALDKNGDGIINDGSELFGTKSGDGFAELAAYDSDGNGWIDEADEIFSQLKVWVKDENGENRLLDLKEANVGAIYLGNVNTQFSLNNAETNATNGVIQKTGVYLREDGTAGTVQHVDLAV
ncbi:MAG: hypothetical protein J1E35_04845 [Lachnospiraceae bacterium]|nr:hypothetical protein [Lachnospiraceae bacterium]